MRQQFTSGQEIVSEDLNTLQSRLERGIYDRIVYEMLNRKTDGFFQDGLRIVFQSSTDLVVKAGLGFQSISTGTKDPVKKPVVIDTDATVTINTPDSGNSRIDLVCAKYNRWNAEQENRKFKDEFTDVISTQSMTVATDWKADILYVPGTPSGSPVAPATPVGYLVLAEVFVTASTGIANQAAITDKRTLLPFAITTSATGSNDFDAIVGDPLQAGVTHADLKSALDNASDGWKILVLRSETLNAIPVVLNDNVEVVFKRGVTFTRGTATIGLQIDGNDCKIVNGRFKDFSTGGDNGLKVSVGALRSYLDAPRFNNCATSVNDLGTNTFLNVDFTE
jgi:hypothetical protein